MCWFWGKGWKIYRKLRTLTLDLEELSAGSCTTALSRALLPL